jgi:hypothetical protein
MLWKHAVPMVFGTCQPEMVRAARPLMAASPSVWSVVFRRPYAGFTRTRVTIRPVYAIRLIPLSRIQQTRLPGCITGGG